MIYDSVLHASEHISHEVTLLRPVVAWPLPRPQEWDCTAQQQQQHPTQLYEAGSDVQNPRRVEYYVHYYLR